jgi:hypothetical protein
MGSRESLTHPYVPSVTFLRNVQEALPVEFQV